MGDVNVRSLHAAVISALLLVTMLVATPAWAAPLTYTVTKTADTADGTCNADCSLREAITAANAHAGQDTVVVPAGTYTLTIPTTDENANADGDLDVTDSVVITGAGSASTIVDGNGDGPGGGTTDRVFDVRSGDVGFRGVTIRDGDVNGNGGGLRASAGTPATLSMADVVVDNNAATIEGGGMYVGEGTIADLRDITVSDNTATNYGGGIYVYYATLLMTDGLIDGNTGGGYGGGLYNYQSQTRLWDVDITDNTSTGHGGGVYNEYSTLEWWAGSLSDNTVDGTASVYGGGSYDYESAVEYNDVTVMGNEVTTTAGSGYGGAIAVDYGTTILRRSPVSDTTTDVTSSIEGGAIYAYDGANVELIDSPVTDTVAETTGGSGYGGAIYAEEALLTLTNSPVTDTLFTTSSNLEGGALYFYDASGVIGAGSDITGTVATSGSTGYGGGLYVEYGGVEIDGASISDNTLDVGASSGYGGGIYAYEHGTVIRNAKIDNNTIDGSSTAEGGGIYAYYGGLTLLDSSVDGNTAGTSGNSGQGGGVYLDYNGARIEDSSINGNTATEYGGGIGLNEAGATLRRTTVNDNSVANPDDLTVDTYGGGISSASDYGQLILEHVEVARNTSTYEGGGFFLYDAGLIARDSMIVDNIVDSRADTDAAYGGGIFTDGYDSIVLERTVLSGNQAIAKQDAHGGGIFNYEYSITIVDSTVADNVARTTNADGTYTAEGGGIRVSDDYSPTLIDRSLVDGNRAVAAGTSDGFGGGIFAQGDGRVNVVNSTLSANTATTDGGGIYLDTGFASLASSTVVANDAGGDGGAFFSNNAGDVVHLRGTLLQTNTGGSDTCDGTGTFESSGYNLLDDGDGDCNIDLATDDDTTDAGLLPLAFNGGHTDTYALPAGSAAIDAGAPVCREPAGIHALTMDQRGAGRPGGSACDVGAYEFGVGVTVTATDAAAAEDGPDTGEFTFARPDTDGPLTVTYVVSGTATAGDDYTALTGTATFADGAATTTAIVTPVVDAADESDETVTVTLEPGVAYTIATPSEATVTIADAEDVVTPPGGAPAGLHRLAGEDRFATAAAVVLDRYDPDDVDTVYLATGRGFPDALAGGPLAISDNAVILLSEQATLPAPTANALGILKPTSVIALGGPVALADTTLAAAGAAAGGATTSRISGADRFATAAAIAAKMPASDTVYLAVGTNFPDALAGGPVTNGAPILLARTDELPAATAAALASRKPTKVIALGGPVAISDTTLAAAGAAAGGATTSRLSGPDRYATATAIAGLLTNPTTVYIAVGTNFPDALAGGPPAEAEGAPILLINGTVLPAATKTYLESLPNLKRIVILGGPNAVPTQLEAALQALLA